MIIFVVFIICFLIVSCYLCYKSRNPYKLIYLFGLKGSGKSTLMVKWMLRDLNHGMLVYTNMADIRIPGVRLFNPAMLSTTAPPPNSAVYLDEAGLIWDNRSYKTFSSGLTEFFKLQRKRRIKVVVNSQDLDVDKKIRVLIDKMYLLSNLMGWLSVAIPVSRHWSVSDGKDGQESRPISVLKLQPFRATITCLPRYWRYFDSFDAPVRESTYYDEITTPPLPSVFAKLRRRFISRGY